MIYMIIEDTASGYDFWQEIIRIVWGDRIRIVTSSGIKRAAKCVERLELGKEDTLILNIDNVGGYDTLGVIYKANERLEKDGINLIISGIYCFEEIFLSLIGIGNIIEYKDMQTVELVRRDIYGGNDYYENKELEEYISKNRLNNREQLAGHLLNTFTARSRTFQIKKGKLGKCWANTCCDVEHNDWCYFHKNNNYVKGKDKISSLCWYTIVKDRLPMEEVNKEVSKETDKVNINYKRKLRAHKVHTKEIQKAIKEMKDPFKYGLDYYEQIYNYLVSTGRID